jgi:membrane protein YqaA with SNARE-associated domain
MSDLEKILLLFSDSFFTAIILYPGINYVYEAIRIFGGVDPFYATLIAALGKFFGSLINYFLGVIGSSFIKAENDNYLIGLKCYRRYLFFFPIFSFLPLWGVFFALISGIFRQKITHFTLFSFMGFVIWAGLNLTEIISI